jgi:hypothetical protein
MSVNLSPVGGAAAQFFTNNGVILSGGKIYTYAAGTTTPQVTYTSSSGVITHTNPIILDSAGRVPGGEIWLTNGLAYKFIVKTSDEVLIGTYDNILGINDFTGVTLIIYNATGTGSTTTFNLAANPTSENTTNVYINGVYQQKNSYSLVSGNILTFSQAPPITSAIEVSYY